MKRVTSSRWPARYNSPDSAMPNLESSRVITIRPRPGGRGFTLIEILVTVAIIGLIAIFVIPNFLDSLNKAKQKKTMAEMHETGKAMMSWLAGQMGAAAAGAKTLDVSEYGEILATEDVGELLIPDYIAEVPVHDAWGNPYEYFFRLDDLLAGRVMLIRSPGFDGSYDADSYTFGSFTTTDYQQDIVWADGLFVRWPVGASQAP